MKWLLSFCDEPISVVDDEIEDPEDALNRAHWRYASHMLKNGRAPETVRHWTIEPEGPENMNKLQHVAALASIIAGPEAVAGIFGRRAPPSEDWLAREVEKNRRHVARIIVKNVANRRARNARIAEKRIAAECSRLRKLGQVDSEKKNHELVENGDVQVMCLRDPNSALALCGRDFGGESTYEHENMIELDQVRTATPIPCPACLCAEKKESVKP